jgi:hypothetical protein
VPRIPPIIPFSGRNSTSAEEGKDAVDQGGPEADVEPRRAESSPAQWEPSGAIRSLPDDPRARHLRLSCPAKRKSFTCLRSGRGQHPYAACSVLGVERVRARRFCSIKGSSTSPQLTHRKTVPSVEYSGRDSAIIKPLHFLQVIFPPPDGFSLSITTANVAIED